MPDTSPEALAKYTFLPWLKQGISNRIIEEDNLGAPIPSTSTMAKERPELTVKLKLNSQEIRKNIKLIGPGDILGISKDAIIREHPGAGTLDFESNCLAYVEFYEEEFPWRHAPAVRVEGQKRLRPWLFLIVAKEEEYIFNSDVVGLPFVTIKSEFANKVLPNHQETWAWAHVHVNGTIGSSSVLDDMGTLLDENPDMAYSRLICPRRLERSAGGVKYHAFLIPAFETGRLAGLGEEPKDVFAQQSSWTTGGVADSSIRPNDYPVYHHWEFATGEHGDFESLVRILTAQPLGPGFGKRDMNISKPGMGLDDISNTEILGLEGALKPPSFVRNNFPNGSGDDDFQENLTSILNISQDLQNASTISDVENQTVFYSENIGEDPIVTPPIYGKWQAFVQRINPTDDTWLNELNLDPRYRATASIGTQTVRKHQEKFMEIAWQQVGDINEANQKIREAEMARMVNNAIYEKHYTNMDADKLLMTTSAAQKFIMKEGTDETVEVDLTASKIPNAARSAAFKKVIRPGKKSLRKINELGNASTNTSVQQSLMTNFNLPDDDEHPALTTAKEKIKPDMTVPTGDVSAAIDCFINMQDDITDEEDDKYIDPETEAIQTEFSDDFNYFAGSISSLPVPGQPHRLEDIETFADGLRGSFDPLTTISNMVTPLIMSGNNQISQIKPIMAYPEIPDPMFEYLQKISQDFIIPNIREIPENTITLLENNQVFIEAFMAGLNHEMSKELLWREFPTDQRGSYFRNFWDDKDSLSATDENDNNHDILPMNEWADQLGEHNQRIINEIGEEEAKKNFVVLVIRGELLRKYPNTVIFAQKAVTPSGQPRQLSDPGGAGNIRTPIFQGELEPDIALFGFNFTKQEAIGNTQHPAGWFFVLQERPGQINFGMDDSDVIPQTPATEWYDLEWGHLAPAGGSLNNVHHIRCSTIRASADTPPWGTNSAEMAFILYQDPIIFARHATEMLP